MSKSVISSSVSLFTSPVPYEAKPPRECIVVTVSKSEDGETLVERKSIEKEMLKSIQLNYDEATLSSLIEHGIDIHALDMVDVNKLGVDAGVDALANHLVYNADKYVVKPSDDK